MRLFLYGTLLDPAVLARRGGDTALRASGIAASLTGWTRVGIGCLPWPTLRRARGGVVRGVVVEADAAALRRLAAYEGPAYRLTRVVATTPTGKTAAWTWIAPGGTHRRWDARWKG